MKPCEALQVQILSTFPCFLFIENRLASFSLLHLPEFQKADSGREGTLKQRRSSPETIEQQGGQVRVPPEGGRRIHNSLEPPRELRPHPVEADDLTPSTRPANQKKVRHPAALTPSFAYKNFSPQPIRELGV